MEAMESLQACHASSMLCTSFYLKIFLLFYFVEDKLQEEMVEESFSEE